MVERGMRARCRVFALGAEGEEEIVAGLQARFFEDRQHDVARGAGIGRAFENDELARPQPRGDRPASN